MRPAAALLAAALCAPLAAEARRGARGGGVDGTIRLAGEAVRVRWNDGDTFRVLSGPFRGLRARVAGVNALETYGPVHRIGRSNPEALYALAKRSAALAAAAGGSCEPQGTDRYGRLLVECPEVAEALVRAGHAMVFATDGLADPRLLELQSRAQRERRGLWAGGAPRLVPTSVHSAGEPGLGGRKAYDRVVDTRTGTAAVRPHARTYRACDEICFGEGAERACLTYVPYGRRYRDRPPCIAAPGSAR